MPPADSPDSSRPLRRGPRKPRGFFDPPRRDPERPSLPRPGNLPRSARAFSRAGVRARKGAPGAGGHTGGHRSRSSSPSRSAIARRAPRRRKRSSIASRRSSRSWQRHRGEGRTRPERDQERRPRCLRLPARAPPDAEERASGGIPYELGGSCILCAKCCEAPGIQVGVRHLVPAALPANLPSLASARERVRAAGEEPDRSRLHLSLHALRHGRRADATAITRVPECAGTIRAPFWSKRIRSSSKAAASSPSRGTAHSC